jgi:hypothetical protein
MLGMICVTRRVFFMMLGMVRMTRSMFFYEFIVVRVAMREYTVVCFVMCVEM